MERPLGFSWIRGHDLEPQSFHLAFAQHGPIGYDSYGTWAALRMSKDDGLLFFEMIGFLHHEDMPEVFGSAPRRNQMIRILNQVRVAMERYGVNIRRWHI